MSPAAARASRPACGGRVSAAVLVMVAACGVAGAAEPRQGVLELPGGGTLPGALASAPRAADGVRRTLAWKSPLFAEAFEFRLDGISGARLEGAAELNQAAFRLHLRGGDMLDGTVEGIDADHVAFVPAGSPGNEAVRVGRAWVEGLSRIGGGGGGTYVGPGTLAGWEHAPASAWRVDAGGIAAQKPGTASRDVGGPSRACYDLVLSWRRRPECRIAVAAAERPAADPFWVEFLQLADGEAAVAVVRREDDRAAIEALPAPDTAAKTVRLVIFVDQEKGRLAALTVSGGKPGPATELTLPPPGRRGASGRFRITLGGGDVRLESLRVTPWTSPDPDIRQRAGTAIVTRDGRLTEAEVVSFDKASGELVVSAAAGESRLKLDDVDDIRLAPRSLPADAGPPADEEPPAGRTPAVRVVQAGGGSLTGRLVAVDDDTLELAVDGIDGGIAIPLGGVASLTALAASPPPELPGRAGTLLAEGVSLRGCVVDGGEWSAGLAWRPQGSETASPLVASASSPPKVVIEYVPRPNREAGPDSGEVEVGGIGGMVNQDGTGGFVVTMLSEDGAAAQDGRLMPGDRLLSIKPREEGGFVPTKGLDVLTVMNLLRGRVGSPIVLRVAAGGEPSRDIDLRRGLIYLAERDVLEQALATHVQLAKIAEDASPDAGYPSTVILRSGDVVACEVVAIDAEGVRLRTPVTDGGGDGLVNVPAGLIQAVELQPATPARTIERPRFDRLLMLPRSQRGDPPTHMVRLEDGDYLRGRLESLDGETLEIDVRGVVKKLPRTTVARVIWLHPEDAAAEQPDEEAKAAEAPAGLLVQGVLNDVARGRMTLVAERVDGASLCGTSPAFGQGRIDLDTVDRLLIGKAIEGEADEMPYRQWRLKPAPEPRSLRDDAEPPKE